jgi:hypothetical protein
VAALEGDQVTAAVATLVIGVVLGYLGQRSRMCFVGGIRDFILVRDTYLLKGLLAFRQPETGMYEGRPGTDSPATKKISLSPHRVFSGAH